MFDPQVSKSLSADISNEDLGLSSLISHDPPKTLALLKWQESRLKLLSWGTASRSSFQFTVKWWGRMSNWWGSFEQWCSSLEASLSISYLWCLLFAVTNMNNLQIFKLGIVEVIHVTLLVRTIFYNCSWCYRMVVSADSKMKPYREKTPVSLTAVATPPNNGWKACCVWFFFKKNVVYVYDPRNHDQYNYLHVVFFSNIRMPGRLP